MNWKGTMKMKYGNLLKSFIEKNDDYFVLTAENLGPFHYIRDDIKNNYLDVGIAEQALMGISSGLALRGRVPIVHAMSSFLTMRPYEFIRTDIGYPNLNVKLIGTAAGFLSEDNGPTHQSIEDISLMRTIPNINIFCPSDNSELVNGMKYILKDNNPWYVRYNDLEPLYKHSNFSIDTPEVIGSLNAHITVVTYGIMFNEVLKAKEILEKYNIHICIVNIRVINTINDKILEKILVNSNIIITVEDHLLFGGIFSVLSEFNTINNLQSNIVPIALNKNFSPKKLDDLLLKEEFDANSLSKQFADIYTKMNRGI